MTSYILRYRGKQERQKSSGLLVATGAGSTGWYDSAGRYLHPNEDKFPKKERFTKFEVREPHIIYSMLEGVLEEGEELEVYSLNKGVGRFGIDSSEKHEFPRGTKVVIRISDKTLRVVARME